MQLRFSNRSINAYSVTDTCCFLLSSQQICKVIVYARLTSIGYCLRWDKMWKQYGESVFSELTFFHLKCSKKGNISILEKSMLFIGIFFVDIPTQVCQNNECVSLSVVNGGQRTCPNSCNGTTGVRFIFLFNKNNRKNIILVSFPFSIVIEIPFSQSKISKYQFPFYPFKILLEP